MLGSKEYAQWKQGSLRSRAEVSNAPTPEQVLSIVWEWDREIEYARQKVYAALRIPPEFVQGRPP